MRQRRPLGSRRDALFDPALLPELPAGLQIGAQHMRGDETMPGTLETDVWVAHVPADVGRLFRACLCTAAALEAQALTAPGLGVTPAAGLLDQFTRERCFV